MGLANSKALEMAGISGSTPDVDGGEIVRDPEGNPTGVLKDNAMDLVFRAIPEPGEEEYYKALEAVMDHVASQGVTSVHHVGGTDPGRTVFHAHEVATMRRLVEWSLMVGEQNDEPRDKAARRRK